MASTLIWLVRFLHILSGVAWVGGAFMWTMVVAPRLLARGPPPIRRPVLEALVDAVPRYFGIAGGMTILWGIVLMGLLWGWGNIFTFLQTDPEGPWISAGFILAVVILAIGFGITTPASKKMLAIMRAQPAPTPGQPPSPPPKEVVDQLAALGKRMGVASMVTVLLVTLAVVTMTWAVNTHLCSGC